MNNVGGVVFVTVLLFVHVWRPSLTCALHKFAGKTKRSLGEVRLKVKVSFLVSKKLSFELRLFVVECGGTFWVICLCISNVRFQVDILPRLILLAFIGYRKLSVPIKCRILASELRAWHCLNSWMKVLLNQKTNSRFAFASLCAPSFVFIILK